MIKNFHFLRRRPDFDHKSFTDYWINEHARIVMSVPHMRPMRYVQNHVVNKDEICEAGPRFDGAPESWRTSLPQSLHSNPEWKKVVLPDERKFIDTSVTVNVPADEIVLLGGNETPFKLMLLSTGTPTLPVPDEATRHVRNDPLPGRQITLEGTAPETVWAVIHEIYFPDRDALSSYRARLKEVVDLQSIVAIECDVHEMHVDEKWQLRRG